MAISRTTVNKVLILFFFGVAAVAFLYQLYLDNYYHLNAPPQPIPAEGRIYPEYVHHGSRVFLTKWEQFDMDVLLPSVAIGSVLVGGLFALRWKLFGADKQKPFWPFIRRGPYDID